MRIAITGGNGGLGRSLTPYLLDQGHEVRSLDLSLPGRTYPPPARSAHYMVANVINFGDLVSSVQGCDAIIHLAAHVSPWSSPHPVVYSENTTGSYNVLYAASILGIKRVCLASSINAIGGVYSRNPRYDYFPLDEQHPTYAEDPYSMSKWASELQGDAFARLHDDMSIASLRFHWLLDEPEAAQKYSRSFSQGTIRHLWAYTMFSAANRACLRSVTADFKGHEVFYIVGPRTCMVEPSLELAQQYYPNTPIRGDLSGNTGFFDCSKAERILGWRHED